MGLILIQIAGTTFLLLSHIAFDIYKRCFSST